MRKAHKYNARATELNGYKFDSISEANRFKELALLESAGKIRGLQIHPCFELQPAFTDRTGRKQRAVRYEADFMYFDIEAGQTVVEDVKGMETQAWLIKRKLFLYHYPELELKVVKC